MNTEEKILEELKSMNQPLGTISTVSNSKPEAATVYFVYSTALNVYFITRKASRKYRNIQTNPNVAFVITTENPAKTIQLEGTAEEASPNEQSKYFSHLVSIASERNFMPPVSQLNDSEMVFMKINTSWICMGNFEVMKEGDKFVETKLD